MMFPHPSGRACRLNNTLHYTILKLADHALSKMVRYVLL
jgi:hypothetical protein